MSLSNAWLAGYIAGKGEFNIYRLCLMKIIKSSGFDITFPEYGT